MKTSLSGKVAIITGANQGLGFEIAKAYKASGLSIMLFARNEELLKSSCDVLSESLVKGQKISYINGDVANPVDVHDLVQSTFLEFGRCDILVNNAGIYGPKGEIETIDWLEWTRAIEINLYGSVLVAREILPYFKKQGHGKIIQLSGGGATKPLPRISAYAASKAAVVRFAETLAEEVKGFGIEVNAIAPGALNTKMLDEIIEAGPSVVGELFYRKSLEQKKNGGASLDMAAELALFLASDESKGISGKLISAVWDNWENWPNHLEALRTSDAYTLRRIVGRDRGLAWGDK
jgi:NAD(P)-dependent dehydrogenase (short-subunit alcohol dehydrogenase family)